MSQTSIQPAALDRGRARRRWLPMTAACALLGLAGALLGSSCGGEELACLSDERCEPCPGHCLETASSGPLNPSDEYIVWVGEEGEEPTCEEYGLEHDSDWWMDLQDDPSCPPCRCERIDCTAGNVGFRPSAVDCEAARDASGRSLRPPWEECKPLDTGMSTAVYVNWYDDRPMCFAPNNLFQPGATWGRKVRRCNARQPREYSCGRYPGLPMCLVDPRVLSDGFRHCVALTVDGAITGPDDVLARSCPSEFPEKLGMYMRVSGCGWCECEFDGEPCSMEFSYYSDRACSDLVLTQTLTTKSVCTELAEPVDIRGIKLRMLSEGHGDCIDHGRAGIEEGAKIEPDYGQMLCCKPLGG